MGIIVGGLLLAVPGAFLASVNIFLIYGVYLGALVQYKEFRQPEARRDDNLQINQHQGLLKVLTGTGYPGKWIRKSHLGYTFLPRYGLLFEDRKGPPKIVISETSPNHTNSNHRGESTTWSVNSDDDISDEVEISSLAHILGGAQAAYLLLPCRPFKKNHSGISIWSLDKIRSLLEPSKYSTEFHYHPASLCGHNRTI